jgi:hypothetical protein
MYGVATVVHLRVSSAACAHFPPLRALRALARVHHLPGKPCVLIYSYHRACAAEATSYLDAMLAFKWQLNVTDTPPGFELTARARHQGLGGAPVVETGGELWHDQDRFLCAIVPKSRHSSEWLVNMLQNTAFVYCTCPPPF